jgi:peptidoglycan hydrolase CwlO-like protein
LVEQQERLEGQNERLTEQNERIEAQHAQLERQQGELERQGDELSELEGQLGERDALLDSQAATLGARNMELRVTAERLRNAEGEAASWRDSTSVRLTKPLRAIGRGARRVRRAIFRQAS